MKVLLSSLAILDIVAPCGETGGALSENEGLPALLVLRPGPS